MAISPARIHLEARPLSWFAVFSLPLILRKPDLLECDGDAAGALAKGLIDPGEAWEVHNVSPEVGATLLGAFGWSDRYGTIWSLWREGLTFGEVREILSETPEWVDRMVSVSGRDFLENHVDATNVAVIKWLHSCGCFLVNTKQPLTVTGRDNPVFYFRTKLRGAN